ncbi:MAG: hypothetical protein ACRYFX_10430 [Janthinobacterium lividum]
MTTAATARAQLWDYALLAARVLLAGTFISYGYGKLTGGQFGLPAAELARPVGELSLFRLSWYLFDQEPFKSFVGLSQVLVGLLLLWNRTALLGALLLLPIAANVLVVDITYLKMPGFYWRLSYYLGLLLLLFWHYRARMHAAWVALTRGLTTHFSYPWWAYLLLPVAAVGLEIVGALPQALYLFATAPGKTWHSIGALLRTLWAHLSS